MANPLNASVVAQYGDGADSKRLTIETDDSPGLVPEPGVSFVRVFPSAANPTVTAVMGGVAKLATNVTLPVVEYVAFNGAAQASLRYAPTGTVSIETKKFFKASPTVVYDEVSNSLILDISAFGIVKISYKAAFDRYKVRHGDSPCRAAKVAYGDGPPPESATAYYDPAFLVAEAVGWETASQEVSGPACDGNKDQSITYTFSKYESSGLALEVDDKFSVQLHPYYFTASSQPQGFSVRPQRLPVLVGGVEKELPVFAGCKVRVYPKTSVTFRGVNCAVSSSPVAEGVKGIRASYTFSGSQSVGLEYPPSGAVSVSSVLSSAVDLFGGEVDVSFRKGGDWVNEVKWLSSGSYELLEGSRRVREDEIVVVTSLGNNTIPCYTFCEAEYTAEYNLFDVLFNWNYDKEWYEKAVVIAFTEDGRMGYLELDPPSGGGVL